MIKSFFIPGNVPSSKNGKQWTGRYFIIAKPVQRWVKDVAPYFRAQRWAFLEAIKDLEPPYIISFKFLRDSHRKFDYVNPLQTIQDMMTGGFEMCFSKKDDKEGRTWLPDDNADIIIPVFQPYEYNKEDPGVWITVLGGSLLPSEKKNAGPDPKHKDEDA